MIHSPNRFLIQYGDGYLCVATMNSAGSRKSTPCVYQRVCACNVIGHLERLTENQWSRRKRCEQSAQLMRSDDVISQAIHVLHVCLCELDLLPSAQFISVIPLELLIGE